MDYVLGAFGFRSERPQTAPPPKSEPSGAPGPDPEAKAPLAQDRAEKPADAAAAAPSTLRSIAHALYTAGQAVSRAVLGPPVTLPIEAAKRPDLRIEGAVAQLERFPASATLKQVQAQALEQLAELAGESRTVDYLHRLKNTSRPVFRADEHQDLERRIGGFAVLQQILKKADDETSKISGKLGPLSWSKMHRDAKDLDDVQSRSLAKSREAFKNLELDQDGLDSPKAYHDALSLHGELKSKVAIHHLQHAVVAKDAENGQLLKQIEDLGKKSGGDAQTEITNLQQQLEKNKDEIGKLGADLLEAKANPARDADALVIKHLKSQNAGYEESLKKADGEKQKALATVPEREKKQIAGLIVGLSLLGAALPVGLIATYFLTHKQDRKVAAAQQNALLNTLAASQSPGPVPSGSLPSAALAA